MVHPLMENIYLKKMIKYIYLIHQNRIVVKLFGVIIMAK